MWRIFLAHQQLLDRFSASIFRFRYKKYHENHSDECDGAENVHAHVKLQQIYGHGEESKEKKRDKPENCCAKRCSHAANLKRIVEKKFFLQSHLIKIDYPWWKHFGEHNKCEWQ